MISLSSFVTTIVATAFCSTTGMHADKKNTVDKLVLAWATGCPLWAISLQYA